MDPRIKWPFNMVISGPTQSGKTFWALKLLTYMDTQLERKPTRVLWFSPHKSAPATAYDLAAGGAFTLIHYSGLPWFEEKQSRNPFDVDDDDEDDEEGGKEAERPKAVAGDLVIIDDFADKTVNSKELTAYLTRHSHHEDISILLISQNFFWAGKESRTQSLNMHYIILMRQKRDQRLIRTLARQISSGDKGYALFIHAYNHATSQRQFAYLLISVHPRDSEALLLRGNIFPDEATHTCVYTTNKKYKKANNSSPVTTQNGKYEKRQQQALSSGDEGESDGESEEESGPTATGSQARWRKRRKCDPSVSTYANYETMHPAGR